MTKETKLIDVNGYKLFREDYCHEGLPAGNFPISREEFPFFRIETPKRIKFINLYELWIIDVEWYRQKCPAFADQLQFQIVGNCTMVKTKFCWIPRWLENGFCWLITATIFHEISLKNFYCNNDLSWKEVRFINK